MCTQPYYYLSVVLQDSRISIKGMMQSPYLGDMRQLVEYWNSALQQVEEITELWFICQKKVIVKGSVIYLSMKVVNWGLVVYLSNEGNSLGPVVYLSKKVIVQGPVVYLSMKVVNWGLVVYLSNEGNSLGACSLSDKRG